MTGPMHGLFDTAEHDRDIGREADLMCGLVDVEPLLGSHLVRADNRAHLIIKDLGGGAGQ